MPVPQCLLGQQVLPRPGMSSTMPLQSLSSPSQISVLGVTSFVQVSVQLFDVASCTHFCTPLWQTPVPHLPLVQQLAPEPGTSSTMPLQSSSRPLHTSVPLSV